MQVFGGYPPLFLNTTSIYIISAFLLDLKIAGIF
jgi:hypothetical protein